MANKPLKSIKFPGLSDTYTVPEVDDTLAVTGAAADAKKVGDEISDLKADLSEIVPGLSAEAKAALLACFAKVAWIDGHGQDYYDALEAALDGRTLGLSAIFTQGDEKYYPFDSLNSLKEHLVVTYRDGQGQSTVITNYTLNGTLTVGESTVTVSYLDKTATFKVAVSGIEFDNSASIGRILRQNTSDYYAHYSNPIAARCRFKTPIKNRNYTIDIVDTAKYSIAGYDLANNTLIDFKTDIGTKTGYLMSTDVVPSWKSSWRATGNYIWCSFKKNDGTDFTASEIENAYGTIYTVS